MSKLFALKHATTLSDLAKIVGFTPSGLSYVLYRIPESVKYTVFTIPKKTGGKRTIKAPTERLELLQLRLAELLTESVKQIERDNPSFYVAAHGFRKGHTIISNANPHRRRRYVFNVDIADFFDSINFGRVRGFFIKDRSFGLAPEVATVIAQIACNENSLPQGSPCSPIISNLVANILDARLLRLAKHARCTYTRYADDLTFSTNEILFPTEIARELAGAEWGVGQRLLETVEGAGFRLNPAKTRMSLWRSCQMVTGLVVNEKPNIRQHYYRNVRAMCRSVFDTGLWYKPSVDASRPPEMIDNIRPLEGMLSHIYFVKARRDRSHKANKDASFSAPRAPVEQYRRLLFYKYFVAARTPIIVAEGVTDITYLKCAIRSRAAKFPTLASTENGKTALAVGFLNATGTARTVLNLGTGAAGQGNLIDQYDGRLKHYRHIPLAHPVIILCDNDDGLDKIVKSVNKKAGKSVSTVTTDQFYCITNNLYLIKVPEGNPPVKRDIEDLFLAATLATLIDGKPFDKKKEHGDHTAYGKTKFANEVVRPNAGTIDFSGFDDLLQRMAACLADYKTKLAAKGPPSSSLAVAVSP